MHQAVLWSMDIDAFELILGRDLAFHEFGDFRWASARSLPTSLRKS